jgi:hypothetical protein
MSHTENWAQTILTSGGGITQWTRLTSRIEHLGYRVHLEPLPTAAA